MKDPAGVDPPPGRGVYVNRTLNLRAIKVLGFDMDYTLVHYHVKHWERRAYEHLKRRLVQGGWPVGDLEFDPELVVRGLVIDTELGNLLKANRFGYVKQASHGTRRLEHDEVRAAYSRMLVELVHPRWRFLNTLFSLSEGCMYAQLVDRLDAGQLHAQGRGGVALGYRDLYREVRARADAAHTEGELKAEIIAKPDQYVDLDEETVLALQDQRHAGKKLVLVTNSEWHYTAAMMHHTFDRFLGPKQTWRDLFELTVCAARKPGFFESSAPLLEVVSDEGLLRPGAGPLKSGGAYFGGNAALLERHLGVSGDEILYLGDHMYDDVRVTKSLLRWRTGLVLRELEDEMVAEEMARPEQAELSELMARKERLEREHCQVRLAQQRRRIGYGPEPTEPAEALAHRLGELRAELGALDERIAPLAARAAAVGSARWGLLLRAGNDKSQLARQIERYADFYSSRVSNLLYATPFAYLRSRRGSLPHDPTD
jgi:HAD superfamily 5'-nucleotidase-like hydrolase